MSFSQTATIWSSDTLSMLCFCYFLCSVFDCFPVRPHDCTVILFVVAVRDIRSAVESSADQRVTCPTLPAAV